VLLSWQENYLGKHFPNSNGIGTASEEPIRGCIVYTANPVDKRKGEIMKVLVFGSLNIDYNYSVDHFVQKGETLSSSALSVFSGGKGLNQAIALAKAGVEVYQAGCIGEDGKFLVDILEEAGVQTRYIDVRRDVRTGNAVIQNDKEGDNCILLYGGANQAISKVYIDVVLADFTAGDYIILQNEINEMAYIIKQAKEKGMIIVLNPSPMDEKIHGYPLDSVTYLMLNEVEAAQLLGHDEADEVDADAIAEELHQQFPQMKIVLTLGSSGSVYKDAKQLVKQKCYQVKTVDTTAAGDTYTGYFFASLMRELPVQEAMDVASRAAAVAVGTKGAATSIPYLADLEKKR